ncbi:unnamed protein product [Sphenostylis stenocarpa]|uniref:PUM-HD domain-containing protein n=1 Tax=Sphenostylis stenocarpa TaxID=92480 RepID=A0AA86W2J4_9FABA|nr:unnamed protein product [Sphenostylis stenocarpa]
MALIIKDHPFPFMEDQIPTNGMGTSSASTTIPQDSWLGWLRHGGRSVLEVQSLACPMETLNLGSHDYETHQYHERTRNIGNIEYANDRVQMHQYHRLFHHPHIGGFSRPPSREEIFWALSLHTLEPPRRNWVSMAKDPQGSRRLQRKIDEATPQENYRMLNELKDHLHELMKHPYGNFVILKVFRSSNVTVDQKNTFIFFIIVDRQKLKDVCMHDLGNRVIQQILENNEILITINLIAKAMRFITVALMKSFNGGYVIHQCLRLFPPIHKNTILDVVAKNCYGIAIDRYGCCIIQKCIEHDDVPAFYQLVYNLILNAEDLANDQYGNYVLQFLIKRKIWEVNALLILELRYKYVRLSTNKYASNVVENLLQFSRTVDAAMIAHEIMQSPDFLRVVQHQYGNYVVQRALQYTQGYLHESLRGIILSNNEKLNSCLYGKMVLQFVKGCSRRRGLESV